MEKKDVKPYQVRLPMPDTKFGTKRAVRFKRFNVLDFDDSIGEIIYVVENLDDDGNITTDLDRQKERIVTIPLSNTDRVIEGMLIEKDDPRYEEAVPEFDWWMNMASQVPLTMLIAHGTQILIQTGRFDRA